MDVVEKNHFVWDVSTGFRIGALETRYLYWWLHGFTIVPILVFSYILRLPYLQHLSVLLKAIFIIAVPFWIWDVYVTWLGVWGFNSSYTTGLILNLPLEEWLFFVSIPFACLFIYESLAYYGVRDWLGGIEKPLTGGLAVLFILVGFWKWGLSYTSPTFLLAGFFALYHYIYMSGRYRGRFYLSFLISMIPFVIVDGILTGSGLAHPIVLYNPDEFMGIRLLTIPLEDMVYCFLMLFSIVSVYEAIK